MNQVLGDGMMLWFGASIAPEDPTMRGYAALAMQTAVKQYAAEGRYTYGVPIPTHMGLNAAAEEALGRELAHLLPVRLEEAHALAEVVDMRPPVAHCHHGIGTLYVNFGQREQALPNCLLLSHCTAP